MNTVAQLSVGINALVLIAVFPLEAFVVVAAAYMLLASLAMAVADACGYWLPRGGSVRGTLASSVLPAVALVALAV